MQESFKLVCDKERILNYHGSIYFLGLFFGSLLCGFMSDRIGRIKWFRICIAGITLCALVLSSTHSIILHLILWLTVCIFLMGIWVSTFTYCSETVPIKYRDIPGLLQAVFFGTSLALCSSIAYIVPDWKDLTLYLSFISCAAFFASYFLPESPRWLWSMNRFEQAIETLKFAVRLQGATIDPELEALLERIIKSGERKFGVFETIKWDLNSIRGSRKKNVNDDNEASQKSYSVVDLFRHRSLAFRILLLSYHWIVVNALYYGLLFGANLFKQQLHLYTAFQGFAGAVGCLWGMVLLRYLGRKTLMVLSFSVAGCVFLLSIFVPSNMLVVLLFLSILGKLTMQLIFTLCYTWTAELNPTVLRSSAVGFGSMTARLTGLAIPYFSLFSHFWDNLPLLLYSMMAFSVIICSLMLPETRGRKLPETIEEGEAMGLGKVEMNKLKPDGEE